MTSTADILLADARDALVRQVAVLRGRDDLEQAFAAWLLQDQNFGVGMEGAVSAAASAAGAARTYHHVAALGFGAAAAKLSLEQQAAFQGGLAWLLKRSGAVRGMPVGFTDDAIALLGIVAGAVALGESDVQAAVASWLECFVDHAYHQRSTPGWHRCLLAAVKQLARLCPELRTPDDPDCADVRIVLRERGLLPSVPPAVAEAESREVLRILKAQAPGVNSAARAALLLAAFDCVRRCAPTIPLQRITAGQVADLLRRVPAGLRKWTWETKARTRGGQARQWQIDHEYHVQNLLYFLLAPIFPDLKEEEYTPSTGPLQTRADLAIPSLQLIIEVKFRRATTTFATLTEQIAADSNLYLRGASPYRRVIVFVWDDARGSEEHPLFIEGLREIAGVEDVVVIQRPGSMGAPSFSDE